MAITCSVQIVKYAGLCLVAATLSACGGGQSASNASPAADRVDSRQDSLSTEDWLSKGAELNRAELARAMSKSSKEGGSLKGAKASAKGAADGSPVTVYRFFNSQTSAHFYTASEAEKSAILATLPQFKLDGAAFVASSTSGAGLSPVYRFFNTRTGVHFYTISEDEKAMVQANLPQFQYEGVVYFASQVAGPHLVPLYRLYQQSKGFHFYSSSAGERDSVVNTLPQYRDEGISYFVISSLKLPHSGVSHELCFQMGGAFVDCGTPGATSLNTQQDGHRSAINPMSFGDVPKVGGGYYARSECVRDNVTGLTWEGKESSGPRSGANTYTNFDDVSKPQKDDNLYPTQADIDAVSNSVGYVAYVNSIALCGFTDWRLPSVQELQNIADFGAIGSGKLIDATWFPNSAVLSSSWSSTPGLSPGSAWYFDFGSGGGAKQTLRAWDWSHMVRLVRSEG